MEGLIAARVESPVGARSNGHVVLHGRCAVESVVLVLGRWARAGVAGSLGGLRESPMLLGTDCGGARVEDV